MRRLFILLYLQCLFRFTLPVVLAVFCFSGCASVSSSRGVYHEVQRGESLAAIARVYGTDASTLATWNNLDNPDRIKAGDRIFIPRAEVSKSPPKGIASGSEQKRATDAIPPKKNNGQKVASIEPPPRMAKNAPRLRWPLENPKLLSAFGPRDGRHHDGLDLGASRGTKIRAAADGRVIYADNGLRGYGNLIIIRHEGNWATVYAHNDENLVEKDDFVRAGEVIGTVGDTGVATTTHLHFELRDGKTPVDPAPYLK